ncbi:MAG: DUF4476 domain-containing protein [Deltaproteobacteria bacterium]|nr:DUF4476 domain-containing protein [Deltaproteobacteria bacterium]
MKKISLIVIVIIVVIYHGELFGCKCIDPESIPIDETIKKSTTIFIGEVISIESEQRYLKVKFDVLASYKGIKERSYIVVKTAKDDAACGYPFKVGKRYLVFTYGEDAFYTGRCSRTKLLKDSGETIAMLPKPIFSVIEEAEYHINNERRIDSLLKQIEREIAKYNNEDLLIKIKDVRLMIKDYYQSQPSKECKCPTIGCPPCPPCPHTTTSYQTNQINEQEFAKFYSEFKNASSDNDRLRILESLLGSQDLYLSVSQIISLLKEVDFSSNRKKFFKIIKGHVSDPHNIYQIYNHLDFESEKEEVKKILEGR